MKLSNRDSVVLDTLLPRGADPRLPEGVLEPGLDAFLMEFDAAAPTLIRGAFRVAMLVATWVSPALIGKAPPLGSHSRAVRERALEAMAESRMAVLRQLFVVLKLVVALAYASRPRVREGLGDPLDVGRL